MLYAESSAVLAWLLEEDAGETARRLLASAPLVVASHLTLIECDRVMHRALHLGELSEVEAAARREVLSSAAVRWHLIHLDDEVAERARRPFPSEPIRTLDAIHLASALVARAALPELSVLSLDRRVRGGARGLGFRVVPE